jgi:hypothetical protein
VIPWVCLNGELDFHTNTLWRAPREDAECFSPFVRILLKHLSGLKDVAFYAADVGTYNYSTRAARDFCKLLETHDIETLRFLFPCHVPDPRSHLLIRGRFSDGIIADLEDEDTEDKEDEETDGRPWFDSRSRNSISRSNISIPQEKQSMNIYRTIRTAMIESLLLVC